MSQIKIFQAKLKDYEYGSHFDLDTLEKEVNGWLIAHNDDIEEVEIHCTELAKRPVFWVRFE